MIEFLVVLAVMGLLVALILPAVMAAREAARGAACRSRLKQIGLALANYEATCQVYPFGVGGSGPPGYVPRWSAQAMMLGELDQWSLFNALNFSAVPWSHDPARGATNTTALAASLEVFLCPSDSDDIDEDPRLGHNSYRANAGTLSINLLSRWPGGSGENNGVFWYQSAMRSGRIRDGLSMTAAFSERCLGDPEFPDPRSDYYLLPRAAADPFTECASTDPETTPRAESSVEWSGQRWADGNVFYTRYHHILPPNRNSCHFTDTGDDYQGRAIVTASSRHPIGVHLLKCDGSVVTIKEQINDRVWQALGTVAGGELIDTRED